MFKNVAVRFTDKNCHPVSILFADCKIFEKLVDNRSFEKYSLFSDFQYDFSFSRSTTALLIVLSDRIIRAFNRSGGTQTESLDISKTFEGMCVKFQVD